jgi:hypothetical protein
MPKIDWKAEVRKALAHVQGELSEAHRGAFVWYEPLDTILVFDNRRSIDQVEARQLEFIRKFCAESGATVKAWAAEAESWAMLTRGWDALTANDCVWAAWHSACSEVREDFAPLNLESYLEKWDIPFSPAGWLEYQTAIDTIDAHFVNPNRWKNCHPRP